MSEENKSSIVDAIFDRGLAWVDAGLSHGKTALETTADALSKTAKSLDTIRERLAAPAEQHKAA